MDSKGKTLAYLVPLAIVDAIIPLPIIGLILAYVIIDQPPWFLTLVDEIYGRKRP